MGGRAEDPVKPAATQAETSRAGSLLLLVVAIAAGAYLRFDGLGKPSYWLDEILHQHLTTVAAAKPWWQWLGRLEPEHAGLYYLTQLVTRVFGTSEFAGRSAAAFFGLATIPLVWLGARRMPIAHIVAAILLATSPLHVYYSREARGYALLMFLTAALIVILLRGRSLVAACVVLPALLYTSAVAAPVLVSAAAVSFLIAIFSPESRRWYAITGACAMITLGLIRVIYVSRPLTVPGLLGAPPMDLPFFASLARMFSVSALGAEAGQAAGMAMLVFALIGVVALARRDWRHAVVLAGMTVLPLTITLTALRVFDHFFGVRYVVASLVGYVMLAAIGIAFIAQVVTRRAAAVLAVAMAVVFAAQGWGSARTEPFQKLDWRGIAKALRTHVHSGDVILAAEPWSEVSLRYYLGEVAGVKLIHMRGPGIAQLVADQSPAAWLVTAGASADPSVRQWMCRYPVLLSSPLEGFRLHYAPSAQHFLRARSGPAEQRAASAALGDRGFTLRMGAEDDIVIGSGWAQPEGSPGDPFRWAIGRRAMLIFPRHGRRDRTIRFQALPLADPALPPQNVHVSLNSHAVGTVTLAPQWSDYSVDAAAAFWNDGMNTLSLDFDRANAPASNDPASVDRRELAAAFRRISIDDAGFDSNAVRTDRPLVPAMRIALLAPPVPGDTRFPVAQLRRQSVEPLLGRLGIDPVTGWTKIARAEVRLEDVVETIAFGSDCEDDDTFLRRAFAILLERQPNEIEQRDLLRRLRNGATREHVIERITKSGDFIRIYRESAPHPPAAPSPHRGEAAVGRRLPIDDSRERPGLVAAGG
jgi:hypothetical protein